MPVDIVAFEPWHLEWLNLQESQQVLSPLLTQQYGRALERAGDEFDQSYQTLRTGPTSTTVVSSSVARIEVFQTGPNSSSVMTSDRDGNTTATGTLYSAPIYDASPRVPTWRPPVDNLFQDPLRDPLGLINPDH